MRAKELGAKTILERGSAHIERQKEILEEEFRRAGVTMRGGLWNSVGTELQEYALADRIEVPSTFASTSFEEKGFSSDKIIRSGLGVNLEHFRPVPKKDDVFRVIFVGQLSLQKGATYLLRVAQEVKKTLPIEFWHVGAISSDFKMLLKEYVPNVIEYKGKVPQKELAYYYSQSNVFLMPSVQEGFGMVQVQAMACGLPLICTTNTGGGDLIAEGVEGFVVPIRDAKAVREKVLFLYNNPEICREMGRAARLRVESGFTWDDYGDLVEKKYSQFLNETCKA